MNIDQAYHLLFMGALIIFAVLIGVMLIRAVIGPRITDRILSINMIGTMTICSIAILSGLLHEGYLTDVALIYAMLSFVAVLILAVMYIPAKSTREKQQPEQGKKASAKSAHKKKPAKSSSEEKQTKEEPAEAQTGMTQGNETSTAGNPLQGQVPKTPAADINSGKQSRAKKQKARKKGKKA